MRKGKILAAAAGIALFFSAPCTVWGEQELLQAEEPEVLQAEMPEEVEKERASFYGDPDGKILNHIYLESVDVSGMNREEALRASEKRMEEITGYQIMLHMDDQSVGVPAKELGVSGDNENVIDRAAQIGQASNVIKRFKVKKDLEKEPIQIPLKYKVDEAAAQTALKQYCEPLNREMENYGLTRDSSGTKFVVTNGQRGVTLKEEESVKKVKNYLTNVWRDGIGSLDLEIDIVEPGGSREELARITDVLGQGSTDYSASSAARATNIKNGTSKLNGKVLYPGESFSVCTTMMPFDEDNGYEMAPSYANGEVVESFGGGICQVSTTLYLAVLRAELEVTERHNHSMSVGYVKPSMDAAIAEGSKDFRFTNNLDAPIYIEGYASSGKLSFAVYGEEYRPEGRQVKYESETLETIEPTVEMSADSSLAFGQIEKTQSAHTGYNAVLWKVVTENGEETREQVNSSYYMMAPTRYKVGVKTSNAEAESALRAAVSTNDLEKVYAVWSQY